LDRCPGVILTDSDIDLLIIKDTDRKFVDRIADVLAILEVDVPVEPLVYTTG
jgi:predicted nucleotidyltransferase